MVMGMWCEERNTSCVERKTIEVEGIDEEGLTERSL